MIHFVIYLESVTDVNSIYITCQKKYRSLLLHTSRQLTDDTTSVSTGNLELGINPLPVLPLLVTLQLVQPQLRLAIPLFYTVSDTSRRHELANSPTKAS